jgi:hypothetical protein
MARRHSAVTTVSHSLGWLPRGPRNDLDVDDNFVADHRDSLQALAELRAELAPAQRRGRDLPARRLVVLRQQFHMERDLVCYAMHGEIAEDVARVRSGLFHAPALERDL